MFIVIWFNTGSDFLGSTAMDQIFLSFPLTYFLCHYVFSQLYFAAMQFLTIFLLLVIGAYDVFVLTNSLKQVSVVLGLNIDLLERMK